MGEIETRFMPFAALHRADDWPCLEFVNTVAWRKAATPEERLGTPAVFLAWCRDKGLLSAAAARALATHWQDNPGEADEAWKKAVFAREAIYRLFQASMLGETPSEDDLEAFNQALDFVPHRHHLEAGKGGVGWALSKPTRPEMSALAQIVWSAADLLASPRHARIKQCEDPKGCGWLFLDESRAGTRKWCSMGNCGNRAKAHRHHQRAKRKKSKARG